MGGISDVVSRTEINLDRSSIGGVVGYNGGRARNINATVMIRVNNPGHSIGGFATYGSTVENSKISGWIRFPFETRAFNADTPPPEAGPENSFNLATVGGFYAFGSANEIKGSSVNVNICGNISIAKDGMKPYSLKRAAGIGYLIDNAPPPTSFLEQIQGTVTDQCPPENVKGP